ncbi:MAG: GNAT family N-acetyltransferase, partial [bacterium]
TMELDGLWRCCPDPHGDGEALGFWRADRDFPLWREVAVPSCFEAGCAGIDYYEGVVWYRRTFAVPDAWHGQRLVLRFEAVNYRAKVWLNGECLGEHQDGFLPFEFEVGGKICRDRPNLLAVAVDNAHHEGDVPGMHVGWRGYGGIIREVSLYSTPLVYVERVRIHAKPDAQGGTLAVQARIRNAGVTAAGTGLEVAIQDADGTRCLQLQAAPGTLAAGASDEVTLTGALAGARAWSPSSPVLYQAVLRLSAGGEVTDEVAATFGFRHIEATPEGLLLNGERIFLAGFNRHEDSPQTAMATDLVTTRQDLERMKEAGANFVRLCHYPHHPAELDLCDRLGLLVLSEIPLYFWNNSEEGRRTQAARVTTASRQLEQMIERDFNHASVIFWSVSNETPEGEPGVAEGNQALIRLARTLDPSRLCVHVMNRWEDGHAQFVEDDVVCINSYPAMDFEARGHQPGSFGLARAAARQRERIAGLHGKYPSKPILIAEFGYSSFAGTFGHAFGEDEHARSIETEFATFDAPYVCGATIWCWADHPWPGGRFFNGLATAPFGVVSRDRRRLMPYWTARAMFRARQGLALPPQSKELSGTTVIMIRPHMRDIPQVPMPAGYGIRPMTVDDIGLWTDIWRDVEPNQTITDRLFRDEFGDDLGAVPRRCFIVTDSRGLAVGTISAWYIRDFHGRDVGRIHWVAVRPSCQGKGLGKAMMTHALNRLAAWHDCSCLYTATERAGAIALYLSFGFEPDMRPANAQSAWAGLNERLNHPAVGSMIFLAINIAMAAHLQANGVERIFNVMP